MDFDTLATVLTFCAGLAIGVWIGAIWSEMTAATRAADPDPETQDEIFTGRFGRIWRDR